MKVFVSALGFMLLLGLCAVAQTPVAHIPGMPLPGRFHGGFPNEPVRGYFQPVQIRTPDGSSLSAVHNGRFSEHLPSPLHAGMLIGCDYRLKITGIPFNPGKELFPAVTLLARTYPPPGKELDYPIIINLTLEDLELALAGQHITRVIYLENPRTALPLAPTGTDASSGFPGQISHDIRGGDPIAVAASQGLPVAIVRLGGRVPTASMPEGIVSPEFAFGSPPWVQYPSVAAPSVTAPGGAYPGAVAPSVAANSAFRETERFATAQPDSIIIDPALKTAGLSVIEQFESSQSEPHIIPFPHHTATSPGLPARTDEYLSIGNDSGQPAFVDGWTVNHFNPGDTIAHFDTLDGRTVVEPSNRIHLYAPRFGAIRKIEGLAQEGQVTALVNNHSHQSIGKNRHAVQASWSEHEMRTQYSRTQDQIRSIESQGRGAAVENAQNLGGYNTFLAVDSGILQQRTFGLEGMNRTQIERGALNARAWSGNEGLRIQVNELAPMTATVHEGAIALFQIEDKQSRTSQLRLIKVASRDSASPGDVVEFTLRFDNTGNQLLGNVTVLDDLPSRLEFLPGTAVSSLTSGFAPTPNSDGGTTLRFEILEPLAPAEFGVIQFQCRVR